MTTLPTFIAGPPTVAAAENVPAAPPDPSRAFLQGLAAYLRASKHRADPLVHEGAKPVDGAAPLIEGTGSRKGLFGTAVKIGQSVFHIYYRPNGEREVVKVAGPGIHGVGVVHGTAGGGTLAAALRGTGGMLAP